MQQNFCKDDDEDDGNDDEDMLDAPPEPWAPEEIARDDPNADKDYSPMHTISERNTPTENASEENVRIMNTSQEVRMKLAQDR